MKVWAFLVALGVGGTVLAVFLTSPVPVGDGRGKQAGAGHRPPSAGAVPVPGPGTPEGEPERIARHRRHRPEDGIENERSFFGEVRDWARTNPEAAIAWAQPQPDGDEVRTEALTDACFQIAQTDPKRAVILAEQFNLSRDAVLQNLAQQWAARDLAAACQWITEQSNDDQRNALVTGATFVWSQTAPADAARFVADQMTPGSARDAAVLMVLHQWAALDSAGATAWIEQFPEGPLRDQGLGELTALAQRQSGPAR